MSLTIRLMEEDDIKPMTEAFRGYDANKNEDKFRYFLQSQKVQLQSVWIAFLDKNIVGYTTVIWDSCLPAFKVNGTPEISDLNVLPAYRKQGIASKLLDEVEAIVSCRSPIIGIGVGLTKEYGSAQRLYFKRGYMPLGTGLTYKYKVISHGEQTVVDDDLVFWLTKEIVIKVS